VHRLVKKVLTTARPAAEAARRQLLGIPRIGEVDLGDLRRTSPISRKFGVDRGLPIDRYYIEKFLLLNANSVRGRVLEVGEDTYTRRFGSEDVVCDVLHVSVGTRAATIVADLADAPHIPADHFDAIILTQTLQLIYEPSAAIRTLYRILRPGGALLLTVPGITPVATRSVWGSTWYWSFTEIAIRRLLMEQFGDSGCQVATHGNVLAAVAFLEGLATHELALSDLDATDADYPVIITARALKAVSRA
jgi:SAM-dependent methyltransferase